MFLITISGLKSGGHVIRNEQFFDTLYIQPASNLNEIKQRAQEKRMNLRYYENGNVSLTICASIACTWKMQRS
jgi:glycine dehydrogenase